MLSHGRIVVTGGAGFIGSALVWGLNRRGFDRILISDRLDRSDKWRNLNGLRFEDYVDADELFARSIGSSKAFGDVGAIFHLGACSSTTETDMGFLVHNNFEYSKQMATWSESLNARLVYASSAATYGAIEGRVEETACLDALRPLNAYAFSKHLFDCWAQRTGVLNRAVGLKYFNVFGPNENHKGDMRSMVNKAYRQIRATGCVKLFRSHRPEFKDGEQLRDFVYVKDAVAMTLHLAETESAHGLYNVGSGLATTWLDLIIPVFAACDLEPRIEFIDMPEAIRGQYQYHTCAAIERLRKSGYTRPITPVDEAVWEYVRDYLIPGRLLGDEN
jgi:ADP-L-glycero-D-manno-heptose 6-epimerase